MGLSWVITCSGLGLVLIYLESASCLNVSYLIVVSRALAHFLYAFTVQCIGLWPTSLLEGVSICSGIVSLVTHAKS